MTVLPRFLPLRNIFLGCFFLLLAFVLPAYSQTARPSSTVAPSVASTAVAPNPTAVPTAVGAVVPPQGRDHKGTFAQKAQSLLGLLTLTGLCFVIGQLRRPRHKPLLRTVVWGLILQFVFAVLVLNTPGFFGAINAAIDGLLGFLNDGTSLLFGKLIGNNVPVGIVDAKGNFVPGSSVANTGASFAFTVLPTIIFFSALSTLMYYLGVLQPVVRGLSWVMQRSMGTSGSETLSGVANIFLGQTEAPLFVRPFIAGATKSELMAIMTGGFSNIASGVLAAYVAMLVGFEPQIAGHLLSASIISAPASLVVAKLLIPESEPSETMGNVALHVETEDANVIDAAARGSLEGLQLALNVGAMLIVFLALVAMLNAFLGWGGELFHFQSLFGEKLSMQFVLGWILSPVAWLIGVPWSECTHVGSLIGIKTVLNEFVAYQTLATSMGNNINYLDGRSFIICAYSLCGFANFSSIAIQIGGIGSMAPERRGDLSRLGMIAMFGGAVASCMTACVVGVLL